MLYYVCTRNFVLPSWYLLPCISVVCHGKYAAYIQTLVSKIRNINYLTEANSKQMKSELIGKIKLMILCFLPFLYYSIFQFSVAIVT